MIMSQNNNTKGSKKEKKEESINENLQSVTY